MMHITGNMEELKERLEAVSRFIRFPNLIIIAGITFLLRWFIILPFLYRDQKALLSPLFDYALFALSAMLLAAGGYIINDYFDIRIDTINRPGKRVISQLIGQKAVMRIYYAVNGIALAIGTYLAFRVNSLWFGLLFPTSAYLFWIYSLRWKQLVVIKNTVVAFSSVLLIAMVFLYEFFYLREHASGFFATRIPELKTLVNLFIVYAGFAFITTLFREIIKDMEDMPGDKACETHSLPVVLGIAASKWIAVFFIVCMIAALVFAQVVACRMNLDLLFWYILLTVQLPAVYLIVYLIKAQDRLSFHLSAIFAKLIMVTGILSMLFL